MTIPPDVAEAAERMQVFTGLYEGWDQIRDRAILADFALTLLAAQQQAAEREKPVDEEWLQSLERVDGGDLSMICVRLCDDGMLHIVVNGWVSPYHATRGELLDLLKALKIQAKGSE